MAKKKPGSPKKIAKPVETAAEEQAAVHPLVLASPIADRAELLAILMAESSARRTSDAEPDLAATQLDVGIEDVRVNLNVAEGGFAVLPRFSLRSKRRDDPEAEPFLEMIVTYVLLYRFESSVALDDANYDAFARTVSLLAVWPYWREFVQDTSGKMGFRPVTLPLYKV